MQDAVELEKRNVPMAVVCTSEFEHEAHVQRAALGMNDLEPVIITHPLSTLTDQEIESRIYEAVTQAKRVWMGLPKTP